MFRLTIARAAAALALLPLAGCHLLGHHKPGADTAKIADAVKADVHKLLAEYNAHDADKAASHDSPGYVSMFHGTTNGVGPEADAAEMKRQMADPAVKFEASNETVDVARSGDLAVYRATYAFTYTDPKTHSPTTERGNWIAAYHPQADGTLKLIWSIGADTPSAAPAAAR